jgi:hypothetical protein
MEHNRRIAEEYAVEADLWDSDDSELENVRQVTSQPTILMEIAMILSWKMCAR